MKLRGTWRRCRNGDLEFATGRGTHKRVHATVSTLSHPLEDQYLARCPVASYALYFATEKEAKRAVQRVLEELCLSVAPLILSHYTWAAAPADERLASSYKGFAYGPEGAP
jgi:hypothetical protein